MFQIGPPTPLKMFSNIYMTIHFKDRISYRVYDEKFSPLNGIEKKKKPDEYKKLTLETYLVFLCNMWTVLKIP